MDENKKSIEDILIDQYAAKLEDVYNQRTAGDFTFHGILTAFLNDYDKYNRSDRSE